MEVELLGQACALVSAGDVRLLSDPWFSGAAHQGGWLPFPHWGAEELRRWHARADEASHVYVSHDHEDHFDPTFLASLRPKVILTGRFRNARFRDELTSLARRAGHRVEQLDDGATVDLGSGVTVQLFLEQPSFRTNSIMVVRSPEGSLLNGNDCGLDTLLLRRIANDGRPTIFLFTLNFLANGYPYPYLRANSPELRRRTAALRDEVVEQFRSAMEILRPELSLAFAGPVTFADAVNAHLDALPEARDWRAMVEELRAPGRAVDWPAPGSSFVVADGRVVARDVRPWDGYEHSHRAGYDPPPDRLTGPDQPDRATVVAAAHELAAELRAGRALLGPGPEWSTNLVLSAVDGVHRLETGPVRWHVVCAIGDQPVDTAVTVLGPGAGLPEPRLQIIAPPASLLGLCDGSLDYDGFLLSGRARFARAPDSFDSVLHNLLRFGRDPEERAALAEWWATGARLAVAGGETLRKRDGDRLVTIPRRCPHEGEPFDLVEVCGGRITCPRHRWVYDVDSGACLKGDRATNLFGGLR